MSNADALLRSLAKLEAGKFGDVADSNVIYVFFGRATQRRFDPLGGQGKIPCPIDCESRLVSFPASSECDKA
jgi:hypothetical protein